MSEMKQESYRMNQEVGKPCGRGKNEGSTARKQVYNGDTRNFLPVQNYGHSIGCSIDVLRGIAKPLHSIQLSRVRVHFDLTIGNIYNPVNLDCGASIKDRLCAPINTERRIGPNGFLRDINDRIESP